MNDLKPENLFKYALRKSLERDRIIKQLWIEKKSTLGKKQKNKNQRVFFDARSELNRKWITVQHISSATSFSHARSTYTSPTEGCGDHTLQRAERKWR